MPDMTHLPTKKLKSIELKLNATLKELLNLLESKFPDNCMDFTHVPSLYGTLLPFIEKYHSLFDQYTDEIIKQQDSPITCKAACSNCCDHYPMTIEPFELIYFYFHLRENDTLLDYITGCFENHAAFSTIHRSLSDSIDLDSLSDKEIDNIEEHALGHYFAKHYKCTFNNSEGSCGVYSIRPTTCRMYLSLSHEQFCTSEKINTKDNKNFIVYLPDQTEELICQVSECFDSLNLPNGLFSGLIELNTHEDAF